MYSLLDFVRRTPLRLALFVLIAVFLLLAPAQFAVQADPVSLVIGLIITATAVVVVDYFVCGFDIFFFCDSKGNIVGRVGPDGELIPIDNNRRDDEGRSGPGNNRGNWGGSDSNGSACTSTLANACGMHGTGFIVNGICNATPPSNSSCPIPTIGTEGFYADPPRVRAGNTTTLHWDVTNATLCALTGGGLSLTSLGILGSTATAEINSATTYSLTCSNGPDGPQASEQTTVTIVPSFEEI
ncbi:MAG: hypothetical protein Q8P58_01035 [Candidatus Adlerbacteria bacterium]|nr:hypothetical protein [Candidatus Adlerbacteria bacterium]MDZ4226034.1 hypothetical protein [Patescibacteria group bacterium]